MRHALSLQEQAHAFSASLDAYLGSGDAQLNLPLNARQKEQLGLYLALLIKWNRAYNLTAIREPQDMLVKHLLDSLSIAPHIEVSDLLDVGSGGGLPGVPLAIAMPDKNIALLDSNGKKTRFLQQLKGELQLDNVSVLHTRVENYREQRYAGIICRAFAALNDVLESCRHLCHPGGFFYLMKGACPDVELEAAGFSGMDAGAGAGNVHGDVLQSCMPVRVPALQAQRHLLIIRCGASAAF